MKRMTGPILLCLALSLHFYHFIILLAAFLQPGEIFPCLGIAGGMNHVKAISRLISATTARAEAAAMKNTITAV